MTADMKRELREAFKVVDTCLASIYAGDTHMYRPLAAQLRILLCDKKNGKENSLIVAVYPNLTVSRLAPIVWSDRRSGHAEIMQPANGNARIAQMPFELTIYSNGLAVADVELALPALPIGSWAQQTITVHPTKMTVFDVIKAVADKGGGAHVDANSSPALRYLAKTTPAGSSYGLMFILAVGRFAQRLGEGIFRYTGCRVDPTLKPVQKWNLAMAGHKDWAEFQK